MGTVERPARIDWRRRLDARTWLIWRIVPHLWRVSPGDCLALGAAVLLSSATTIAMSIVIGLLIGAIPHAVGGGLLSASGAGLLHALVALAVLYVVQLGIAPIQQLAQQDLMWRVELSAQQLVVDACNGPEGIRHLEDPAFDDRVAIAFGQGGMAASMSAMALPTIVSQRISGLGALVILFHFAWWAPVAVIAGILVIERWVTAEVDLIYRGVVQSSPGLRRADYHHRLALTPEAAKEIRLFGLAGWVLAEHAGSWYSTMREVWRGRRNLRGEALVALLAGSVAMSLVFGALVVSFEHGSITLAAFTIYGQAALGMIALAVLGDTGVQWRMGSRSLLTALDLHDSFATAAPGANRAEAVPDAVLRFENLSFSYPGSDRRVFDRFDLRIERGQTVAIVGENGSGKTTLIKLLARLYEADSGRITCGDVDIRDLDVSAWRRHLAVIFQDFTRYPISLRENIALGALDLAGEGAVADAAERAGIGDLAAELPSGWDTILSRSYTHGVDLSGGQWQRVALARALMASARDGILVLDEPTASLDVRQEAAIFDRSIELTRGLTTILISHRFSTVRHADRIVVLAGGRVVEDGSHEDLMRAGGRYARMFTLQASRFQEEGDG